MEKQRLMSDEEEHFLVRNDMNMRTRSEKSKETYRQCDRRSNNNENSHNSFLEGKSSTSEHLKQQNKSNNFMSAISDFFGLKSSGGKANGSSNCSSLVVSVLIAFLYVASAVFLSNGCESLVVSATPLSSGRQPSMFHSSPSARNIRHLPCISRRTKEEGICMFAIDCLKANGTHLGTCIDRFYFGSCCQMPEQLDPISTNHIEDNTIFGQTFLKPKPEKIEPDDKLDSILNSLSPLPSSTFAPKPTSPKTVEKVQPTTATPKPSTTTVKPSVRYTTTQKPKPQSLKPSYVSQKPSVAVNKPTLANQKYGGSSQKPNATQIHSKLPTTAAQGTRRPHPSTMSHVHTKKPITTGVVVNNTYSSKLPSTYVAKPEANATKEEVKVTKPVEVKETKPEEEKVTKPEEENIMKPEEEKVTKPEESSIKPLRNATVVQTTALPLSTTTQKSAYIPTRRVSSTSTTETPSSTTKFASTTVFVNETTTAKAVTADLQRVTSTTATSTTTRMPETTTQTYKISTFQSVQGGQTQKTTRRPTQQPSSNRPITTKRPPAPEKEDIGSQLPFGTRLPSTTVRPEKPTVPINIKTPTSQINRITSPSTSTASPPASTTQVPSSQRPIQRPKPTFKPERPTSRPSDPSTTTTIRPLVQRPPNSTLSNRRTTTLRPTTLIKRPTVQAANVSSSVGPTKRPTTIIYRPSIETKPSLKPTYITMKPASPATPVQMPAITVTESPSHATNFTRRPVITTQAQNITKNATTQAPVKVSENKTTTVAPLIKKPVVNVTETIVEKPSTSAVTSTSSTTAIPSSSEKTTTAKPALSSTVKPTTSSTAQPVSSTTVKTVSTSKAPPSKPLVKPSQGPSIVSVKPTESTQGPTTVHPITNDAPITNEVIQDNLAQKPTEESKTPSATTQKIGLVTWSNYVDTAISQNSSSSTTEKEEDWSPITPPAEWVLLQTVSPTNLTGPTESPPAVVAPAKKPIFDNSRPKPPTPVPSSTTVKPSQAETTAKKPVTPQYTSESTTKRVVTAESTTKTVVTAESTTKKSVVTESATKKPETETTSTKKPPTKPVFTVHITTKPAIKPAATENATTVKPAVESSSITSVSGGSTTTLKPVSTTTKIGAGNTTSSDDEEESTTLEDTTTNEGENATTMMGESGNTTTSSGEAAGTTDKSTVSPIEGITSSGSPIANIDSLNMSDYKDVCGRRLWPEARVVGGSRANFGRWPWQVSLRQWRTSTYLHKCGAALLSENWAVTAAHCVDSVPPSDLLLRLGEHDLASEEEPYGFQERRVQIVASHPQFDPRTFEYDLALLRFYEPVTFQPNILPVCVPANDEGFVGKTAYVTGWGRLYEDGPLPSVLQEVSVPVLENQACEQMYRSAGYIEHIPHIFICAGWRKGGFDSCEGDSGGPMVIQRDDKRFMLGGIISWGIGCAEPNQPGVYTRISEFRDWINQILQF